MVGTELSEDGQRIFLPLAIHTQQVHGEEALDKEAPVFQSFSHIDLCCSLLSCPLLWIRPMRRLLAAAAPPMGGCDRFTSTVICIR